MPSVTRVVNSLSSDRMNVSLLRTASARSTLASESDPRKDVTASFDRCEKDESRRGRKSATGKVFS